MNGDGSRNSTTHLEGIEIFVGDINALNPSTVGQNIPLLGGNSTYSGGNNPKTYAGDYDYSYIPTQLSDYPAIGHDRRYDNLGIKGAGGLLFDTRAIGADWKFVNEQFTITSFAPSYRTKTNSLILGIGLGLVALPKTLYKMSIPGGYSDIKKSYNLSNKGVTNKPSK